ncbi:hypothetical protein [Microbacterium sp. BK668]|uniref:hypothetical protein n=1 Tax=Microbacterium sp. BK668 TaxID=2512118 RepID=UPI00105B36C2|nr:hypothetical protein [Microbacterium sp. BK668]TDN87740.1 hypothetical protein EV279_3173 [Microbacterium sp. BK668]
MPDDPKPGQPGHGGEPGDDGPFDAVTRLYIRTNAADNGTEPLPAILTFWTSPDIQIVKPGGGVGGEAVPLQLNHIKVTVTNGGGIPAIDAYVDAWVADPSTGISPATAFLVGGDYVTVQAYSTANVLLPWTPQATDAGHRCVVARVSLIAPFDSYVDGTVFDVVGDRHVAQRNIQVLEVAPGERMSFRFLVNAGDGGRALVRARETTFEMDARALAKLGGCEGGLPATIPLADLGVRMLTSRETLARPSLATDVRVPLGVARAVDRASLAAEVGARLDPEKARYASVTFAVSPDDEVGRLHAFDVVQLDEQGTALGGLSFVVRVV